MGSLSGWIRAVVRWLALAALLAAVAVAFADSSIVVLALPELLRQFDVSITGVAWVVSAYNLSLAVVALAYTRSRWSARLPAARAARVGALVFLVASLGCAAAPAVGLLVACRVVQGAGAALLLVGALPLIRGLARTRQRGTALWAGAGVFGAALGPALGGALTDVAGWRAVFLAQAPVAALALVAALGVRVRSAELAPLERTPGPRRHAASLALALASAALVGLLFLAVVQLVDVWRLTPLAAAAVVSVIPLATVLAQPLASRLAGAEATGAILLAAGLAGMGFLPARSVSWVVAALAVAGAGLGLLLPGLTRRVLADAGPSAEGAAHTAWIRHAGLVAGILLLAPLLTADLTTAGQDAKLRGVSVVLDAPVSFTTKARLALDVAPVLTRPPRAQLPDFASRLGSRHDPTLTRIGRQLDGVVEATVTRGFRRSYLLAGLLGLLALVPLAVLRGGAPRRRPGAAVVALAVAAALVGAELAAGAQAFGARPRLEPPCASRPSGTDSEAQQLALEGLDAVACRFHKSREQLLLDVADWARGLHLPFG